MAEGKWLEISVTVDDEMAEAVAEVLSRYVSQGVVMERAVTFNDAEDEGTPYGPVKVYGYLAVDASLEETRQRVLEGLWYLGRIRPEALLPEPTYRTIDDQNWMAAWKEHYHPIPVGEKLLILPAWIEQTDMSRIAVKIDPSMAFGTGTHPTTQLCMQAIEKYITPGVDVIDVGCGSGILTIAAMKMGAGRGLAVDIDNAAVISTVENSSANGTLQGLETGLGSVAEVLDGRFSYKQAPFVLANILAPVLIRLFDIGLADLVSPGGVLVLSGILEPQAADVIAAGEAKGMHFVETLQMLDWVALVFNC